MSLSNCKKCEHPIDKLAQKCPNCGAEKPKKKGLLIFFSVFIFLAVVGNWKGTQRRADSSQAKLIDESKKATDIKQETPQILKRVGSWVYDLSHDKMRNETTKYAEVKSINQANFQFPYSGGSSLTLLLRKTGTSATKVMFIISKGQFLTEQSQAYYWDVKFDQEKVGRYTLLSSSSGKSDVAFVDNSSAFVKKVLKAKKLIIEPKFYNHGKEQFEFNLEGLRWR